MLPCTISVSAAAGGVLERHSLCTVGLVLVLTHRQCVWLLLLVCWKTTQRASVLLLPVPVLVLLLVLKGVRGHGSQEGPATLC